MSKEENSRKTQELERKHCGGSRVERGRNSKEANVAAERVWRADGGRRGVDGGEAGAWGLRLREGRSLHGAEHQDRPDLHCSGVPLG